MTRRRQVKIVATLGPASSDRDTIKALFETGVDVFRLNMSHGTRDEQRASYRLIREIEDEVARPIGVLVDLQGPKIRCGVFADGPHVLAPGDTFRMDSDDTPGDASRVMLPHREVLNALVKDAAVLVNDGRIRMRVTEVADGSVDMEVVVGGEISDRKGVNLPDIELPLVALSHRDRLDLEFACGLGADWIALSFVQRASDVEEAKALIQGRSAVMCKIEKPAAVDNFAAILKESDGIMVARGDLGVEIPLARVPPIQKKLIRDCRKQGKPVVVATQMLESMTTAPLPTRAEVSDVASAIYDGADAVMLSEETAVGSFPVRTVATMDDVAIVVERDPVYREIMEATYPPAIVSVSNAIAAAAREVAESIRLKAICCFTTSGATAMAVAKKRPAAPIIALTPSIEIARQLTLAWGLHCVKSDPVDEFEAAVRSATQVARDLGLAGEQDHIVVVAGVPFNQPGSTNVLRVASVDSSAPS